MKNKLNFIGCFMIAQSFMIGISLSEKTSYLEEKVCLAFVWFLIGVFILIKNKK